MTGHAIDWDDIESCEHCECNFDVSQLESINDELLCEQCAASEINQ